LSDETRAQERVDAPLASLELLGLVECAGLQRFGDETEELRRWCFGHCDDRLVACRVEVAFGLGRLVRILRPAE
jgi:hypothetical protein